ncbi:MAG TPA: PhoU domain-containing protein, partial [Aliarcobacter cryaerophilus]|nr:PhoU domain-containing protein [Aliarcobacter cryaerophilus]
TDGNGSFNIDLPVISGQNILFIYVVKDGYEYYYNSLVPLTVDNEIILKIKRTATQNNRVLFNDKEEVELNAKDFAKMFRRSYSEELNTNTILEYTIPLLKSALLSTKTAISIIDEQEHSKVEEKYQRVIVEESKTDDLYLMIEKNILKLITQKLDLSKEYFDLLSSLRRLEKIADRSVSIASLLQFAKLGGDIVQS